MKYCVFKASPLNNLTDEDAQKVSECTGVIVIDQSPCGMLVEYNGELTREIIGLSAEFIVRIMAYESCKKVVKHKIAECTD